MKDLACAEAKLQKHVNQSIGCEIIYTDSVARPVHNELMLHLSRTKITLRMCGGMEFNISGSICCKNMRYVFPSRRSGKT